MSFWKKISEINSPAAKEASLPSDSGSSSSLAKSSDSSASAIPTQPARPVQEDSDAERFVAAPGNIEEMLLSRFGKTRSALGAGTVIQGKLSFDTPVRIDGKLSGELYSSRALIVGPTGQIDAQLEVQTLIVLGSLKGVVRASERIEILGGGVLEGEITTPVLVIQDGCKFSGGCKMVAATQGKHTGGTSSSAQTVASNPASSGGTPDVKRVSGTSPVGVGSPSLGGGGTAQTGVQQR